MAREGQKEKENFVKGLKKRSECGIIKGTEMHGKRMPIFSCNTYEKEEAEELSLRVLDPEIEK